jgi:hypothetical protein
MTKNWTAMVSRGITRRTGSMRLDIHTYRHSIINHTLCLSDLTVSVFVIRYFLFASTSLMGRSTWIVFFPSTDSTSHCLGSFHGTLIAVR